MCFQYHVHYFITLFVSSITGVSQFTCLVDSEFRVIIDVFVLNYDV